MQVKNTKKMSFVTTKVKKEFTSGQLTSYSGLSVISDFIKHIGIYDSRPFITYGWERSQGIPSFIVLSFRVEAASKQLVPPRVSLYLERHPRFHERNPVSFTGGYQDTPALWRAFRKRELDRAGQKRPVCRAYHHPGLLGKWHIMATLSTGMQDCRLE